MLKWSLSRAVEFIEACRKAIHSGCAGGGSAPSDSDRVDLVTKRQKNMKKPVSMRVNKKAAHSRVAFLYRQ